MNVFKVNEHAEIPQFATKGSACFDVRACLQNGQYLKSYNNWNKEQKILVKGVGGASNAFQLPPGIRCLVPTGLIFDIPWKHVLKLYIRSSVALKKGLILSNGTGIIDCDYVNECFMMVSNVTDSLVTIEHGERLAQAMLEETISYDISPTEKQPIQKTDRIGGLGSTGI